MTGSAASVVYRDVAKIRLPEPHAAQEIFVDWEEEFPEAQVFVAPSGTKVGKTFGCALWELQTQLVNPGLYGVWIAPTLYKCRIGYRYMRAMLPDIPEIKFKDSALEIWFGNGSFLKFLHGRDAEVTVEGEAVDTFVVDEGGKQQAQLWHSLFTTITQTEGKGIITGTPRGHGWYFDLWKMVLAGDPFFCGRQLRTIDSPFVNPRAIEKARRLLPQLLFRQYYLAEFVSDSTVYGDLSDVWQDDLPVTKAGFWLHPDEGARKLAVTVGVDLAKRRDYTVFYAITQTGQTVGYVRFRRRPYRQQIQILDRFLRYFQGEDNSLNYDRTGVGDAVGEEISAMIDRHPGDWTVNPIIFTNASKQNMVARVIVAAESGWWKCPRIPRVEHEFVSLEVKATKSGLHSYAAPDGDFDDAHWAAAMAIEGAHHGAMAGSQIDLIEAALAGKLLTTDDDEDDDDLGDEDDGLPDDLGELDDEIGIEDDDDVLEDVERELAS